MTPGELGFWIGYYTAEIILAAAVVYVFIRLVKRFVKRDTDPLSPGEEDKE